MDVTSWLLDSDPSLRWQVLRDLAGEPAEAVDIERARVAREGWCAQLLELQDVNGTWDGGTYRPGWVDASKPFFDAWTATHYSLQLMHLLGPHRDDPAVSKSVGLVSENVRWDVNDALYFEGETEPCVNGIALSIGSYFGQNVDAIVATLLDDRLGDGGWNCWAEYGATASSFSTTICVLEGLLAWELAGGSSREVTETRQGGEEYLLERGLFRSKRSGRVVDPRFTMFSFPFYWYYDVLRALDYFRATGAEFDDRCTEALDLVAEKRGPDGRWRSENTHQGPRHFHVEVHEGDPSRWNTLRAMRILDWAGA